MGTGITFPICSMLFSILLIIIYFSKKRLTLLENKLYKILVISNLFGLLLEIGCFWAGINYIDHPVLSMIILKGYLFYFLFWLTVFAIYIFTIADKNKDINSLEFRSRFNNIILFWLVPGLVGLVLVILLPLEVVIDGSARYTKGMAADLMYIYSTIACVICSIKLIVNFKTLKKIKATPIILFIIFGIATMVIQSINPGLILTATAETLICLLMFHTIENPDLQMLNIMTLAKDDAEKANRAKSDFITNMSHEIRTPLTSIIAFSEEIKDEDTLEKAKQDADQVIKSGKILLEVIGGILDMSKIESGKMEIIDDIYNTRELFESVSNLISIKMREKNLLFNVHLAPDLPVRLYGDKPNIQKVLMNLLSNAYKYTNEGQVDLKVDCVNKDGVSKLIMSVQDTGRGIKTEKIDKLFEKFERDEEDKNTTTEGTGLGLAITKKIVELMGGKVVCQSTYGKGSRFTVSLNQKIVEEASLDKSLNPILNNKTSSVQIANTNTEEIIYTNYSNKVVLATDDNNMNLSVIEKLLNKYNIKLVKSTSSADTLERIDKAEKYDLLLMDIEMPIKKGPELMKELKTKGYKVPIIAWTANATSGDREKYIKEGFDDYISKPTNRKDLDKLLHHFFDNNIESSNEISNMELPMEELKEIDWSEAATAVFDATGEINPLKTKETMTTSSETNISPIKAVSLSNNGNVDYLKENGADMSKALEILGDMEMYNETMATFYDSTLERMAKIESYKNSSDMPNYAIEVHALKSDLKYLGFYELAEIPYKHEMASKENNIKFVNDNYNELIIEINKILNVCKEYLGK